MPPSSTPQHMRWTLSMPESRSSSRGSMICSGRQLTVAPPSVLAFLWNPNRMPTILQFMMATQILAKPFSPSVHWCFHCTRDVIAPKKQKWHSFLSFSLGAPVNGVSLFGDQPTAPWRHLEASSSDAASHLPAEVEPMQLGRLRLTPQQRQALLALGLCLYCGKAGHFVLQCPLKVKAHQ